MAGRRAPSKTCGDFGGRTAKGRPCRHGVTDGLCSAHLEGDGRGRPTLYTPERAEEILSRLASGELLTRICREPHLPAYRTVARWAYAADEDLPVGVPPSFRQAYAGARELQALHFVEEGLEIADATYDELYEEAERRGIDQIVINSAAVQRAKLRVETRNRLAALLDPKRLAERKQVDKKVSKEETQRLVITEIRVESPSRDGKPAEPSDNGRPGEGEEVPRLAIVAGKGAA